MIATFYSFKGGVGRSFTLVETALQLAARGRSVVVWDLDLEAPGVQKIPDLRCLDDAITLGTLDLLREFLGSDGTFPEESLAKALLPFELPAPLAEAGGKLSFLLPDKLDGGYAERFGAIDWAALFDPKTKIGTAFFYKTSLSLTRELGYEILLIDSRTGYTDLGGICTIQLPDLVVLVTNLNEQNLAGIEQVRAAVTRTPARLAGKLPAFVLANMVPDAPEDLRARKLNILKPHHVVPLHPELLLTDQVPTLAGLAEVAADFAPVAERIEARRLELEELTDRAQQSEISRANKPEDLEALRRRGIYEKAKTFEQRVAELFSLLGYRTTVDYKRDDMQFDVRLELSVGVIPIHALVECKDLDRPVTQQQVREFASKVEYAADVDKLPYQGILVARSGFANNAHEVAKNLRVNLQTYEQLLRSLVDLRPNLEAAIRAFQGTALERLYVEQDVVFESDIKPETEIPRKRLTDSILRWLKEPSGTFLALLGDFGCGKTSFSKRLACELAVKARAEEGTRAPVLIDLREGGSTTVTLESLLTQHFQRLSSQPFNPQALLQLNREGYLVLIFDGFDETIAYTEPGRYVENLRQILRAAEGKAKVLMTCRTHYFRDRPEVLSRLGEAPAVLTTQGATQLYEEIQDRPGTEIGYLLEFQEEQISAYLKKALLPPADWRAFREQIRQTYNLNDLAERPFLLEIIVKTLPRLATKQGEVTIADLYESYCESWFSHNDLRLTLTRERKVALVEYLARLVWDSPENRVHYHLLFEKATEFFKDKPLTIYDKERVDYEVRTALFLHRDAEGYYSFIHRSFLEFFIARTIRAGLAAGDSRCLALRRITREVAFFLEFWPEAKRIPDLAREILEFPYQSAISENALLLLYFHARASFGPLVGPGTESEPDFLQVREVFSRMRPKTLLLDGADLEGVSMPGVDLSAARLDGARLERVDLRQASLDRARLTGASLGFANLRKCSAEEADFSEADLNHLDAREADLRKTVFRNADLSFARLTRANLHEADLRDAEVFGMAFNPQPGLDLRWQAGHSGVIHSVAWSPDGQCVATGSNDGTVKIWDPLSGRVSNSLSGHDKLVLTVSWSPDGTRLASGSSDKTVKVWEASSGRLLNTLVGHNDYILTVSWSPDGTRLASGAFDKTVKVWEADSGRLLNTLAGHDNSVTSVSWSPDGTQLASGAFDNTVRVWEAASGRLLSTLTGHDDSVTSVSWSPDGTRLASGSFDHSVKVWEASGRFLNTLSGHYDYVLTVSWSPDGTWLASGSDDQTVKVWEPSSGRLFKTLSEHGNSVLTVSWSPDGTRLASGSSDKTVKVWELSSGRLLNTLSGQDNSVLTVSWSPDGMRLASGSFDKTVKVWEMSSGRLLNSAFHDHPVRSVTWSPDGEPIASQEQAHADADLQGLAPSFLVTSIARSPDGRRLAALSAEGFIEVWDLEAVPPHPLVRLYANPNGSGFAATPDGYVFGPPEALDWVRFGDGFALYDVTDVPERVSEERILAALAR